MRRLAALVICLGAAAALAWRASQPPQPLPASAPDTRFSAARALADIEVLARAPHPLGSGAHATVAAYLLERMQALGLEVRTQQASVRGQTLRNLIGVLPGRNRAARVLALLAHYDTVPDSPGAADDSTGVAAALEIIRALRRSGPPARDVALVITDGEELGLLGARAFYDADPLAARIGLVLNMEARGGGGRVFMFETGPGNGALIDVYRRVTPHPSSNSLAVFVYRHMPNDTDFTIVRQHGGTGLNYAFIGRPVDYHAPSSTVARLERGSVQHLGDQVLAVARTLAHAAQLPPRRPERVYADYLGLGVLAYAPAAGWLFLLVAAALGMATALRVGRGAAPPWRSLLRGALATLLVLPLAAALALLARHVTGVPSGFEAQRPLLAAFGHYECAIALCSLGAALLLGAWSRATDWGSWLGSLASALFVAFTAQLVAPLTAFLIAWPLLIASATAALAAATGTDSPFTQRGPGGPLIVAGAALSLAQCLYLAHVVLLGVGADQPVAASAFAWLGTVILYPLLQPFPRRRTGTLAAAAIIGSGIALAATVRWQVL